MQQKLESLSQQQEALKADKMAKMQAYMYVLGAMRESDIMDKGV